MAKRTKNGKKKARKKGNGSQKTPAQSKADRLIAKRLARRQEKNRRKDRFRKGGAVSQECIARRNRRASGAAV